MHIVCVGITVMLAINLRAHLELFSTIEHWNVTIHAICPQIVNVTNPVKSYNRLLDSTDSNGNPSLAVYPLLIFK